MAMTTRTHAAADVRKNDVRADLVLVRDVPGVRDVGSTGVGDVPAGGVPVTDVRDTLVRTW
jgi:hypothetical protein